jgi:FkbM family methyltransferase
VTPMTTLERLLKPEYVLQPSRLWRRLLGRKSEPAADGGYDLPLPWGVSLRVRQLDEICQTIDLLGVYDLVVTEAIWRLVRPGDTVLDVGANVGYVTLAMSARLARSGRVFAFEPHPDLFGELARNVDVARERFAGVDVNARREALSDSAGTFGLRIPEGFQANRGLASLGAAGQGIAVTAKRLDDYADEIGPDVALMKIDVEGHEYAAFRGASSMLKRGTIRNLIMEEHRTYPNEVSRFLEGFGYTIFSLERSLLGPRLGDPVQPRRSGWEAPSFLATRDAGEARAAFAAVGWRTLRSGAS